MTQSKLNLTSSLEGSLLAAIAWSQYRLIWLSMEGVLSFLAFAARAFLFALLCLVLRLPTLVFISAILTDSWLSSELRRDSTDTWRRLMLICESCELRLSGVELSEWCACAGNTSASRRRTKRGRLAAHDDDSSPLEWENNHL